MDVDIELEIDLKVTSTGEPLLSGDDMTNVATRETPLSMQGFRGFESTLPKRNPVSRREALCQYFETHREEFGGLPVGAAAAIARVFTHSGLNIEAQEIVETGRAPLQAQFEFRDHGTLQTHQLVELLATC